MLISWLLSAVVLWLLQFVPFIQISLPGIFSLGFLITAVVIGLINALLVPIVKDKLKAKSHLAILVITLAVDTGALLLASFLPINFSIGIVSAIIAAAILSVLNLGASSFSKK